MTGTERQRPLRGWRRMPWGERLAGLWPKASLRAYLAVIMLVATVPFIALMGYRIYDDFMAQRARMWAGCHCTFRPCSSNASRCTSRRTNHWRVGRNSSGREPRS